MKFYLPGWMWIIAAAALYIFYATNKSNRIRQQNKSERLKEKQDEIFEILKKKNNSGSNKSEDNITDIA